MKKDTWPGNLGHIAYIRKSQSESGRNFINTLKKKVTNFKNKKGNMRDNFSVDDTEKRNKLQIYLGNYLGGAQ